LIPARLEHVAFGLVLSGLMSFIVSGISTVRAAGLVDGLPVLWLGAWLMSWMVSFPVVLVVAPMARSIVRRLVRID
jgi:Protein of unknown function (DUF2798)